MTRRTVSTRRAIVVAAERVTPSGVETPLEAVRSVEATESPCETTNGAE